MAFDKVLNYLRLGDNAEDPKVAMATIERGVHFRGTNLLILVFAILIASVGLNVNSAAVIIGAMLISPPMGPIVGVVDLGLVRRSLYNLGFAVGASLATSTLYFLVSPLSDAHSEILARTSPTIWDVLIALSGGFAGIIAAASKDRGNVVPGVAIATALMPPLCTAGYGLAHLNWTFFAGAFYLFIINSVFISLSPLATVRWLGYPLLSPAGERVNRRVRHITVLLVLVTVVPSAYLAYRLVLQNAFKTKAEQFITYETTIPDNYLLQRSVDPKLRAISLTYLGTGVTPEQDAALKQRLAVYGIADATLDIRTGLSIHELGREERVMEEGIQSAREQQRVLLSRLHTLNDSLVQVMRLADALMTEAKAQHAGLQWMTIADLPSQLPGADTLGQVVSAHFALYPDTAETGRLHRWLTARLQGRPFTLAITATEPPGREPADRKRKRR